MSRALRNRKRKQQHVWGFVIIFCCLVFAVSVGWLYFDMSTKQVATDAQTNCPESGIETSYAIVIDTTDSLSRSQSLFLQRMLTDKIESSKRNDSFKVYFLGENPDDITIALEVCNPGDGSDQNALISNQRRLKQKWESSFFDKLNTIFLNLEKAPEANRSPIIESLKYISIDAFIGAEAKKSKLLIVSDLLEYSTILSHYDPSYDVDELLRRPAVTSNAPYLQGINLELYYIVRPQVRALQSNKHISFWERFLTNDGNRIEDIVLVR